MGRVDMQHQEGLLHFQVEVWAEEVLLYLTLILQTVTSAVHKRE